METSKSVVFFSFLFFFVSLSAHPGIKKSHNPCKHLILYFHDVFYDGTNLANATAVIIVGAPQWGNRLADKFQFGNLAVFDDPITLDNKFSSVPVGRARGMYLFDSKLTSSAWLGFTFVMNSSQHQGTINFIGADPYLVKHRDITVVGGTGDFFMHRGIATITTDADEGNVYFRLHIDIKFYECW